MNDVRLILNTSQKVWAVLVASRLLPEELAPVPRASCPTTIGHAARGMGQYWHARGRWIPNRSNWKGAKPHLLASLRTSAKWNLHSAAVYVWQCRAFEQHWGSWMTPKYSAQWWEKVTAGTSKPQHESSSHHQSELPIQKPNRANRSAGERPHAKGESDCLG